ncbi:MAG: hypothetical protein IPQ09_18640 [Myxococcales bacterium]|nr:hypothetical protein [Myxococcales bacterium]
MGKAASEAHRVHSFDHVAVDESVVACDIAKVPLEDGALDVAIFRLSLMGKTSPTTSARRTGVFDSMVSSTLGAHELLRGRRDVLRCARPPRIRRHVPGVGGRVHANLCGEEREEGGPGRGAAVPGVGEVGPPSGCASSTNPTIASWMASCSPMPRTSAQEASGPSTSRSM